MIQSDIILTCKTNPTFFLKLECKSLSVIRAISELLNRFITENKFLMNMSYQTSYNLANKLNIYCGNETRVC
jgi:hypothetical protein